MENLNLKNEENEVDREQDFGLDFVVEPKVIYAIQNDQGHVTRLVSSVFITEEELAIANPIDSGDGDNYTHVGEYIKNVLGKELFDDNSCANFYITKIEASLPDEPVKIIYQLSERTQDDKDLEIAQRPEPETLPTIKEVTASIAEMTNTIGMLSDAIVEVDNSSTETNATVGNLSDAMVEVDGKTSEALLTVEALSEAVVEVDNRANDTELELVERKTDIEIIMDAIVELSDTIAAIQTKIETT